MRSAGKFLLDKINRRGDIGVRKLARTGQIDYRTMRAFTRRVRTYPKCGGCGERDNWMVQPTSEPDKPAWKALGNPTAILKYDTAIVYCGSCGDPLEKTDRSPAERRNPKWILQPDGMDGTDNYVYSEEASPFHPKMSEVYSLEVEVRRLRHQLEFLAEAPDPNPQGTPEDEAWNNDTRHWRIMSARCVEGSLHRVEDSLEKLKDEMRDSLFTETGISGSLKTLDEWRKQRLVIPPDTITEMRIGLFDSPQPIKPRNPSKGRQVRQPRPTKRQRVKRDAKTSAR